MSHWYDRTGRLIEKVPYKDPKRGSELKDTTLTDARVLGLFPSVTNVADILSEPAITIYRVEQAVLACVQEPLSRAGEYDPTAYREYITRMVRKSEERADAARDMGTRIHWAIAETLRGHIVTPASHGMFETRIARDTIRWMAANGFKCDIPEKTFVNERLGIAGTVDWQGWFNGEYIILDFKSQEWENGKKPNFYVPKYPLQLAGYGTGLEKREAKRYSLVVNRIPGISDPQLFNWSAIKKNDPEADQNLLWDTRWLKLLDYWKCANNYWPEGLHAV